MGIGVILALTGCTESAPSAKAASEWLLAAGEHRITMGEYQDAFEVGQTAYTHNALQDPGIRAALHRRILADLREELVLEAAAEKEGILVSREELAAEVAGVRNSYPDAVFSELLAENALSEKAWERSLTRRLLMEKVADAIVKSRVPVSPEALKACFATYCDEIGKSPEEVPLTTELYERLFARLKQQGAEAAYGAWIRKARTETEVLVNATAFQRMYPDTPLDADLAGAVESIPGAAETAAPQKEAKPAS